MLCKKTCCSWSVQAASCNSALTFSDAMRAVHDGPCRRVEGGIEDLKSAEAGDPVLDDMADADKDDQVGGFSRD